MSSVKKRMILVTGGAGYIGSHTVISLLNQNYQILVLDNFSNSSIVALERASAITGKHIEVIEGDIRDGSLLKRIFAEYPITAVMHFAGLKSVAQSVADPLSYFDNNVSGTVILCQEMAAAGIFTLVFSSSATVYGVPMINPISESCPTGIPTNPYGRSKLFVEELLADLGRSDKRWRLALLRYFNPVGAHQSGMIGESPNGVPNNLMPYISQVAIGKRSELLVFGDDYPTFDGTGVRDYIHVVDLAEGHSKALNALNSLSGVNIWNLGTGKGFSVFQIIEAFEHASGQAVPYRIAPRRAGDIPECWADPSKAREELGWVAERGLDEMMQDTWRWQLLNPEGYSV
ncbi:MULTISPECIES: UDP-glucose 4-epimerase GalE [unclassified Marinobacterium]|uniref:UDP-glucose 4-epimerase GalE n=1 Tax=unclassified Marinobacterium TaxID=2644139 RepID=UPI0019E63514|nr:MULTISPECIES: UDP-glucose 4-epimerase GalE [unclassified Marinobacterium]NRP09215.1 UDP-glucose 4-epimerase [Marinobacterium sp. xm-g-48]NRP82254.1 UDP-glucose 4-epimerase [Marinobacterium sp. xm-d-509]